MTAAPPPLADLLGLAERALRFTEGDAQAAARWRDGRLSVEVTCVIDGRAARAEAVTAGDDALRRAARAAALHARRARAWPSAGLPEPEGPPSSPDEPALPPPLAEPPGDGVVLEATLERIAIASTRGIRVAEQRARAVASIRTPHFTLGAAAAELDALLTEAREWPRPGQDAVRVEPEGLPLVLGPDAVATVLDHLRPAFGVELDLGSGPLHGRLGTAVAAPGVDLAADAGFRYDAEGITRRAVALIDAGTAVGRVHDTASAARAGARSTGHASRAAALAPIPAHLSLRRGTDSDLCGPVARGLLVPALSPAREADGEGFLHTVAGARLIEAGRATRPVAEFRLRVEPLALLAGVEAVGERARTVPRGAATFVVPALRCATA